VQAEREPACEPPVYLVRDVLGPDQFLVGWGGGAPDEVVPAVQAELDGHCDQPAIAVLSSNRLVLTVVSGVPRT